MASTSHIAANIKGLWYCDVITTAVTAASLATLLKATTTKQVKNVHQGTWNLTEEEATTTGFKNQLNGLQYRSDKEMGAIHADFTIGQYEYSTKADLMGGTATESSWQRASGKVNIEKAIIALTDDDQYCVIPKTNVAAREATTDNAVAIPVVATEEDPQIDGVAPEYWFDAAEVTTDV